MIVPSVRELKSGFSAFVAQEQISWRLLLTPWRLVDILLRHRFVHFLVVGGGGAVLGLSITWALTTYVYGLQNYFIAYLIGTGAALAFNFTLYSLVIFKTSRQHARRLVVYFVYIVSIISFQSALVKIITPLVGLQWYLVVIATLIGILSIVNFMAFKLSIFKERPAT